MQKSFLSKRGVFVHSSVVIIEQLLVGLDWSNCIKDDSNSPINNGSGTGAILVARSIFIRAIDQWHPVAAVERS